MPRPRRAAAQRATTAITDMADSDSNTNARPSRIMSSRNSNRRSEVKLPASKLRQAISSRSGQSRTVRESFVGGEILEGKRNRGQKKSYVVQSSEDDDEDAEGEEDDDAEGEDDDMAVGLGDDDADGEDDAEGEIIVDDTMDLDAEGEDDDDDDLDAEGDDDDMDIDTAPRPPTIKVTKPSKSTSASMSKSKAPAKSSGKSAAPTKDSDDDELSDLESEEEEEDEIHDTVKVGGVDADEDAEGEEDEELEASHLEQDDDDDDLGTSTPGETPSTSRAETPDLSKMTKRQRARFEDGDGGLMKLSDEVQAKKHFTAEELSMRRAEMARRRRNLSEKRNEEVKMETINKLLKKQAPKTNRKAQLADDETPDAEQKANPVMVRWINNKDGSRVGVPEEMLLGPAGRVFVPGGLGSGKMVEEVS